VKKPAGKKKRAAASPEEFIAKAATAEADSPKQRSAKSNPPAGGFKRTSFDLPTDVHLRLKIEAAKQDKTMQDLLVDALDKSIPKL